MDWSDEVRARLVREEERLRYKAANLQARGKTVMAAQELVVADDIRAMLVEIERRGLQYPDDLGISRDAAGLSARCAELRDRLVAQGKRAAAAEAKLAEAEMELSDARHSLAHCVPGRQAALAEVERLRGEKAQIVGYIQRWQPAGSPPSTDALGLVRWIMGSVQEKLDAAETLVDSIAPDGVYGDEIAKARAALRGGGE